MYEAKASVCISNFIQVMVSLMRNPLKAFMIKNCNSRSSCNNAHIFEIIIILDIYHPKKYLNNWDAEAIKFKILLEVIVDCWLDL